MRTGAAADLLAGPLGHLTLRPRRIGTADFAKQRHPLSGTVLRKRIKPPMSQPAPPQHGRQARPDKLMVPCGQPQERPPVHPFRLPARGCSAFPAARPVAPGSSPPAWQSGRKPPPADCDRPADNSADRRRSCRRNRHPPATADRGAAKPHSRPAVVARCPIQAHRVALILPLPVALSVPVGQDDPISLRPHFNPGHGFTIARPLPAEGPARCQKTLPLPAPHVELAVIASTFSRAIMPVPAATSAAHSQPPDLAEIIRQSYPAIHASRAVIGLAHDLLPFHRSSSPSVRGG